MCYLDTQGLTLATEPGHALPAACDVGGRHGDIGLGAAATTASCGTRGTAGEPKTKGGTARGGTTTQATTTLAATTRSLLDPRT